MQKHLCGSKSKKPKLEPPKKAGGWGVIFLTFFDPPPLSKKRISNGGDLAGSGQRVIPEFVYWTKRIILQGVKATIQSLGVGNTNRLEKGVCGVFPCMRACLSLI